MRCKLCAWKQQRNELGSFARTVIFQASGKTLITCKITNTSSSSPGSSSFIPTGAAMCKDKLPLLLRDTNHVLNSGVCNLKAQSHMTSLGLIPPGRDSFFWLFFLFGPPAAGGGNLIPVSHFPGLLRQQQLHFSAAGRADGGRRPDQVMRSVKS